MELDINLTNLIREFTTIRLNDVTPGNKSGQGEFNDMNFLQGQIHFRFTTHFSGRGNLIDFQPHRRLFGVIGIMDCQEWKEQPLKNGYQQYLGSLDKYPSPIVTRCFAFDPTDNQPDDTKGVIMIPDVGDKKFYMATLLCDFASDILAQFSILVKDIGHQLQSESSLRDTNYANSPVTNQRHSVPQQPYPSATGSPSRHSVSAVNISSSSSSSPSSSPSTGYSSRLQKRAPGRIKKLYADFYLLSGRLPDALSLYIQSIDMTKITSDHLWLASAMEGYVCTILLLEQLQLVDKISNEKPSTPGALATDSTQNSTETRPSSESRFTISLVLEYYRSLLLLYYDDIRNSAYGNIRYTSSDGSSITTSSNLVYAEACIKVARFLLTVYLNGNLDNTACFLLVQGWTSSFGQVLSSSTSSPLPSPSLPETPISMTHPSTLKRQKPLLIGECRIDRQDIGFWTTRAWEASLQSLGLCDQVYLMTEMTFIYNTIGYYRKAAWLKYQSIQLLLPSLLHRRTKSNQDIKGESASWAFQNIDRHSILVVLKWICKAYGIVGFDTQDDYVCLDKQDSPSTMVGIKNKNLNRSFGWPSLQLTILRKCIITAESLHAYTDMLYYATTLMKNMYHYISKEEQIRLSNTIHRVGALQNRFVLSSPRLDLKNDSQDQGINYWGVNIVTSITAIQAIPRKQLHQYPLSKETIMNAMYGTAYPKYGDPPDNSTSTSNDPFIYNPFTQKKDQKEQVLLVKDEIAEFQVSLTNPFGFDLELQNIQLCTSGVSFQAIPHSTILPAYGTSKLCISGIPKDLGTLRILGCTIKIVGFVEQEFLLNQGTPKNQVTPDQKDFNIVAEQPLMKVKSTSLLHRAIMLFEGERTHIKITLENIGNTPVEFMALSFTDDSSDNYTLTQSSGILSSDLSMEQQYELERISTDKKVFMWQGNVKYNDETIGEKVRLPPGETLDVSIDIYGRRGCTHGTVKVDYGYLNGNNDQTSEMPHQPTMFYTRQLHIPILITVYCHLKPQYWDLLYVQQQDASRWKAMDSMTGDSITSNSTPTNSSVGKHSANPKSIEKVLKILARQQIDANAASTVSWLHGQSEYCLATIDIQNRWSFPFRVIFSIENDDDGKDENAIMDVASIIQPGTTARVLIPVKRFTLPEDITSRSITLESKKQFVVVSNQTLPSSLSSLSLVEQKNYWKLRLELFWYRENLLQRIKASWIKYDKGVISSSWEDGINRQGELDLRTCLRLTSEQLSILKVPDLTFALSMEGDNVRQVGIKSFVCQSSQRVMLVIAVRNRHLKKSSKFILRVQPVQNLNDGIQESSPLQDKLLMEGMNQVILPEILLDQQAQHTIPLYFLAKGRFEFLYHVEDIVTKTTYYDQESCVVDVVDEFE